MPTSPRWPGNTRAPASHQRVDAADLWLARRPRRGPLSGGGQSWGDWLTRRAGSHQSVERESIGLRVGDDVRHAKYGEGVVVRARGDGLDAEATIRFPDVGEKSFVLAHTPLRKI